MKIEKNKNYKLRLLPNINNPSESCMSLDFIIKDKKGGPKYTKFFSYILNDKGKVECFIFGKLIKKFMQLTMTGYYSNYNGKLYREEPFTGYLTKENESDIFINDDSKNIIKDLLNDDYEYHNDVLYNNRINLFDLKSDNILCFDTSEEQGFLKIDNLRIEKSEPLYKEGDDKQKILDLYKGVKSLEDEIEDYKESLINNKDFNNEYIFNPRISDLEDIFK